MSKTLNLNDVEELALKRILRVHEKNLNRYGTDKRVARYTALAVIQSIQKKLGVEPEDLKES